MDEQTKALESLRGLFFAPAWSHASDSPRLWTAHALIAYFGPKAPPGQEGPWIQTIPGKAWFTYFRIYGPKQAAFDGTWKPGEFDLVR